MANFEDFPPIFCLTADFLPKGGPSNPCKIFISGTFPAAYCQTFKLFYSLIYISSFSYLKSN